MSSVFNLECEIRVAIYSFDLGQKIWGWTLQEGSVKIIIDVVVVMEVKNSEHWKRKLKEKILEKLIFFVLCTSIGYSELDYEVPMHGIEGLINKYENIYL